MLAKRSGGGVSPDEGRDGEGLTGDFDLTTFVDIKFLTTLVVIGKMTSYVVIMV